MRSTRQMPTTTARRSLISSDVAHLERNRLAAGLLRLLRQPGCRPHVVDDDGVLAAQVGEAALDHDGRPADQGRVVEAQQVDGLEVAVLEARLQEPLVERHGPVDAGDAAHPEELGVLHRLDVVDELDLGVHDPDVGLGQIGDDAVGAGHQAGEDRGLLGDEEGREGEPHDDAQVLAAIAHEHFQGDAVHSESSLPAGHGPKRTNRAGATAGAV